MIGCVKSERFQEAFIEWVKEIVQSEDMDNCTQMEKNSGRIEQCVAYTTTEIDWLPNKEQWKNLTTIGAIHTEFTKGGKTGSEWHYYISSRELPRRSC